MNKKKMSFKDFLEVAFPTINPFTRKEFSFFHNLIKASSMSSFFSIGTTPTFLQTIPPAKEDIFDINEYFNFTVNKNNFKIGLSFNDVKADLIIGYDAIISFADPYANFGLRLEQKTTKEFKNKIYSKKQNSDNVIDFTNYKKN